MSFSRAYPRFNRVIPAAVIVTAAVAVAAIAGRGVTPAAAATLTGTSAAALAADPASLVNPLIGTSGDVNDFPGPDMPFGMMQWGPDTAPDRADGGGYTYSDSQIIGYSLTHLSGPGCGAYGDVPILPTVGAIGSDPGDATETFSHSTEKAQTGYYSNTLGDGVTVGLTDSTRSGIGTFKFPATTQAHLLLKLSDSQSFVDATAVQVVGHDEVQGQVTAGHFCENPWESSYTLHFDIKFSQPFTADSTWQGQNFSGSSIPGGVALTFNTTADRTVTAKVGISFTSSDGAAANLTSEIPGWNFDQVRKANVAAWNKMLGKIQVAGGSAQQRTEFYTAMYHALLHPNVFSDVNGHYAGSDGKTHTIAPGHAEYANYSGWDTYRGQVQLSSLVAPAQTSDMVTSMLDDYAQTGMLPKWNLGNGEAYVQVGDSADAIIADAYAFGARGFDSSQALTDMIAEATSATNQVRPGQSVLDQDGYLPFDQGYGCCDFYGPLSTQLEYDTDDYSIASLAKALGDNADYTTFAKRSQNWENSFNAATGYLQPKLANGTWLGDFSPALLAGSVEGTSAQYTPMVPFNIQTLITARGGNAAWIHYLNGLLTNLKNPGPDNADLSNEPSLEVPWEYDYAGAPYRTQRAVRDIEQQLFSDTPAGEAGNDDLGALSSSFVWDELGFSPETPGTSVLALASPAFPRAVIHLANGGKIAINAPSAKPDAPYVQALNVNGQPWHKAYLDYGTLRTGASLAYDLSASPNPTWAAAAGDAPPSDQTGGQLALTSAGPASGLILRPGAAGTATYTVANLTGQAMTVNWTATPPAGVTLSKASGTLTVPADSRATMTLTATAGTATKEGSYPVTFAATAAGTGLSGATLAVNVARVGETWPYYNNIGVTTSGQLTSDGILGTPYTYSAEALASAGIKPGGTVTADGVSYTWPTAATGKPDSIQAMGQVIPVSLPAGATKIGLLGSALSSVSGGATGTLTVTYTDRTTQRIPVAFSDFTLNEGEFNSLPSDTTVAAMTTVDAAGVTGQIGIYLFSTSGTLESGKTVASVTLPNPSGGSIAVFAIGAG